MSCPNLIPTVPSIPSIPKPGPRAPSRWNVVPGRAEHLEAATRILSRGFVARAFYQSLLGLEERDFETYWRCFLPFVFRDAAARTFVAEIDGEPRGLLSVALPGFGRTPSAAAFVTALGLRISPGALIRYLGFVRFYERFMETTTILNTTEARGLWLAVEHRPGDPRLGSFLVQQTMRILLAENTTLFTGLVDAGDSGILAFYHRLGFSSSPAVRWRGCAVARVVRCAGHGRTRPCTA